MGEAGRVALNIVGTAVGNYVGGPVGGAIGGALGGIAGSYAFPAEFHNDLGVYEGSRLSDLQITSGSYGNTIPKVKGRYRVAGNIIWAKDMIEEQVTSETEFEGETKGGSTSTSTSPSITYNYYGDFAVSLCAGPIQGVYKIWADGTLIYNTDTADQETLNASALVPVEFTLGGEDQLPSSLMESYEGIGNVPAHRGQGLAIFNRLLLNSYGGRIPNFGFEVQV